MRFQNLHNHSNYSDGKCTVRENVEAAILKNMHSIGFSDHSYTECDPSYCMKNESYEAYAKEITAIKAEYADRIPVYLGLEKDYYSDMPSIPLDYIIASVHYINAKGKCYPIDHSKKQQEECIEEVFGGDVLAMAKCYFDMVEEQVKAIKPTFIGHFDVIAKFGVMPEDNEQYIKIASKCLKECLSVCPYVEVNTGGISRGYRTFPYPIKPLLKVILEEGGEVLLSADSHHTDNLDFFFNESVEILKEIGFDHINRFNGKDFDKIQI